MGELIIAMKTFRAEWRLGIRCWVLGPRTGSCMACNYRRQWFQLF